MQPQVVSCPWKRRRGGADTRSESALRREFVRDHADWLGYVVIAGACLYKVPQIWAIHSHQSAKGLSLVTNMAELMLYTVAGSYSASEGHPLSTYGENIFQGLGSITIVAQIFAYRYRVPARKLQLWGLSYLCGVWVLAHSKVVFGPRVGSVLLRGGKALNIALSLLAKLPQVLANFRTGRVGQQSPSTTIVQLLGSAIRIFTIFKKLSQDKLMVAGQGFNFAMNSVLMMQVCLYPP